MNVRKFLKHLESTDWYDGQITHVEEIPARAARYAELDPSPPPRVSDILHADGIDRFYTHQCEAITHARAGRHVVVVTGTASGKTLCYNVPVLEAVCDDPDACALYLYPTKALAQDQLRTLKRYIDADKKLPMTAGTYDGDTPPNARRKLKNDANVLLTNPDMLHSGILPNHGTWSRFFSRLKYVVVDEVHSYRGVFGSNVSHVLGRLNRVAEHYGARPVYVCCSATIRNPGDLAARLTGRKMETVDDDGAPRGPKTFVIWNPPFFGDSGVERRSSNGEAARILTDLVSRDHQTIVFVRARVVSEIVARYAQDSLARVSPSRARSVKPYRGGYLPEERREIERELFSGELKGVVSTNALELGIDIGAMESSILVGYPGTIASTWQQAGRAGRGADPSLVVLIPHDSPIDQYMARHPRYFFGRSPENAVIDPHNPHIVLSHLRSAAFELPITKDDFGQFGEYCGPIIKILDDDRQVRQQGDKIFWTGPSHPSADVKLRNISDDVYTIIDVGSPDRPNEANRVIGTIDESGAFLQLHPGAVYIHHGETYFVDELDVKKKIVKVQKEDTDYYTQSITEVKISIEHEELKKRWNESDVYWGDLSVTSLTYMFKKVKFGSRDSLGFGALDLPEQKLLTTGMWLLPHQEAYRLVKDAGRVPREGLLGISNVVKEVIPLFAMCDTSDVGASVDSSASHAPGVYVHDRFPGGLGFAHKAYELIDEIMSACLELIDNCPCEAGCPSCVGSPLPPYSHLDPDVSTRGMIPDKESARSILHHLLGLEPYAPPRREEKGTETVASSAELLKQEAEMRSLLDASQLPATLEKKLRERVGNLKRPRNSYPK
ncbi:MAG: DEAD/DEAH box helicase [Candidatus Latescibacterota bacterium]|jgi:DEAD/DEAH box helicase domain-containing protein